VTIFDYLVLLGWIVAFVVANAYSETLATLLPDMIPGNVTRLIVAFLVLFIGVRLLMMLLTMAMDEFIKATGLTLADRGLGSLFGLARGLVIILASVLICGMTALPQQPFWKDALFSPYAETAARTVKPFLPGDFARHVQF
jgi:membrane protein required for colicin V production